MANTKWISMVASIWIQCSSGASYYFGIYSATLKSTQNYDQSTLDTVSVFKDIGANIGVLSGLLYESVTNNQIGSSRPGLSLVYLAGAVQCFSGYFLMWLSVTGVINQPHVVLMCLFMFMAAHAQTFFNTANVVVAVQNFLDYGGTTVGIMKVLQEQKWERQREIERRRLGWCKGESYMAILLLVGVSCLLMLTGCVTSHGDINKHVALFVFGDSIFDSGNNDFINTTINYRANFWPYGISYFNPPSGRPSDGRLIHDFIAEYAQLPLISEYLDPSRNNEFVYGANFASGGSGALNETQAGFVVDLKTQLKYFGDLKKHFRQNLGETKAEQLLSDAVYLFSCGGNDYFTPVGNNDSILYPYTHEQYVGMVIGNLTDVLKGIYEKGGRKFGILTIPPLGCWLSVRAQRPGNTCNEELGIISSLHNLELSKKLQELEKQLEGFMYAKFDLSTELTNRMKNPSKYGFKVGDSACCGSGPLRGIFTCGGKRFGIKEFELCDDVNDYLFFDSNHVTEKANRQFAELFWNVTAPYSLKALFRVQGEPSTSYLKEEL